MKLALSFDYRRTSVCLSVCLSVSDTRPAVDGQKIIGFPSLAASVASSGGGFIGLGPSRGVVLLSPQIEQLSARTTAEPGKV
jgi:hypothetical protein